MQRELHEMKLPTGPRGRALQHARHAVEGGAALDEAFAGFEPAPRRTDGTHAASRGSDATREAVQQIATQLRQIDEQRRELNRLLELLDSAE
ncbi:hypothetical protein KOR34_09330 [Posidoniimonas corsicana]|uniref:Uncharacterized protein n=1 Tax=Posidoniimonas corsicana TaxID=1938618 RepID=A0A5C5VED4_9BACT|nr:hypothetical protein [Posidoniimonas corsicana]TWT36035.1 hypothetical protein KOR34_09330 [Posidoniimonas corsicana]